MILFFIRVRYWIVVLDRHDGAALCELWGVALVVDHLTLDNDLHAWLDDSGILDIELLTVQAVATIDLEGACGTVALVGDQIGGIAVGAFGVDVANGDNDALGVDVVDDCWSAPIPLCKAVTLLR